MIEIIVTKTATATLTEVIWHTPGGPVSYLLTPGESVCITDYKR